ncbi:MAG: class II fructose-bisphosphate aldolase [Spirochaetia bacterium]|nr:class II fructose-bisphosphate aldolase [Spirochaetia bacterium]
MLVNLKTIMEHAESRGIATGAFNVPNWESAKAIIGAAEELDMPVIMNYAPVHHVYLSMEDAAFIMLHEAHKATVPVCVHLDHGGSFEQCMSAIRLGFTSVMIDASAKSLEGNIAETSAVVRAAHSVGVSVEAELGHIFTSRNGISEVSQDVETAEDFSDLADVYTDPAVAKDFVGKTGVDALAIAFGTSHGIYVKKPVLDLNRISAVRKAVNIPLVMHGGSGLSKEEFQTAIRNGIRKINYYTYMTLCGGTAVRQFITEKEDEENIFFHDIPGIAMKAMKGNLIEAMRIFSLQ